SIAAVTGKACFAEKDPTRYVAMAAAAHEMLRAAADLAGQAREMEKSTDSLARTPHANEGHLLSKTALHEKPS
ncbi:MAG: methylenetetrahydromethanopterin dehydrogenase, partial [Gammaproteobacteria bacterium]|nr:methylenetetrahydromethanopterin dehydrogenase [Gammaproteobacteria bacterium]